MKIVKPVLASLIMVLIIGCASKEPTLPPEPIPEWISSPSTENGWVATGCVPSTANLANDMNSADLEAKYQIASSLRTHIQSATGRQLSVVDRNGRQISSHDSFDDKSKLIVDEELIGTRRIRGEYISIEGRRFFCSKVHFDGQIQVRRIVETAPSPEQPEIIDTLGSSCSNPFAWTAAASKVGIFGYFKGTVTEARYRSDVRGQPTWISLGSRFPDTNRLGLVVWGSNRMNFNGLESLVGQVVCVSGTVETFRGVPQIELTDRSQLTVAR